MASFPFLKLILPVESFFWTGFQSTTEDWKERPISTNVTVEWMSKPTVELDENYFKSPPIQQLIGMRKNTIEDETRCLLLQLTYT